MVAAATRETSTAAVGTRNSESGRNDDDHERREMKEGASTVEGGEEGGREDSVGAGMMAFENLNDIPDGELIPAAAATIALESCFLGGRRDQAMEIVWQVTEPWLV